MSVYRFLLNNLWWYRKTLTGLGQNSDKYFSLYGHRWIELSSDGCYLDSSRSISFDAEGIYFYVEAEYLCSYYLSERRRKKRAWFLTVSTWYQCNIQSFFLSVKTIYLIKTISIKTVIGMDYVVTKILVFMVNPPKFVREHRGGTERKCLFYM